MRSSLSDYLLEEISKMKKPLGNQNYDVYDLIMNDVCYEFDSVLEGDSQLKEDKKDYALIKQLNFFLVSFVSNKKMALTEREEAKLREMIFTIDQAALKRPNYPAYKVYNESYRKCMLEFLEKSAHFKLNKPSIKIVR